MNGNKRVVNLLILAALFLGAYFLLNEFNSDMKTATRLLVCEGLVVLVYYIMLKLGWIEKPASYYRVSVEDPLTQVTVQEGKLHLNEHQIPLSKIKKIVLDKVKALDGNEMQGLVQLPFNQQKGDIPELWFDSQHFETLKAFLKQQIPHAVFIK